MAIIVGADINSGYPESVVGQQAWIAPGTYSWTCPAGVTSVCVLCIGTCLLYTS